MPTKLLKLSRFKFGVRRGRVGKAEARAIEYSVALGRRIGSFWWSQDCQGHGLDRSQDGGATQSARWKTRRATTFIEVYREFVIDPKLNAKVFELPK